MSGGWGWKETHERAGKVKGYTAFRQSLTYPISGMWVFWLPLAWIGFEPQWVVLVVGINLGYQFFVHTQAVHKLPAWIEFLLNTPSHHRVHHARNDLYVDRNFGGVLIIWDRLFGTFVEERDDMPCEYGITRRQITTHNPITLTFQEWRYMWRQASRPGLRVSERLRYLWGHPDWEAPGAMVQPNSPAIQATGQPVSTVNKAA